MARNIDYSISVMPPKMTDKYVSEHRLHSAGATRVVLD